MLAGDIYYFDAIRIIFKWDPADIQKRIESPVMIDKNILNNHDSFEKSLDGIIEFGLDS
jgi:hypothetical protein